ncbi:ABC transporter permease [Oscillibacter sp.]|uniref:ABC transporter permease n=1 Tax=Oscillibacter sp. TaxID=1945593 RepID=UPI002637EF4C|nr:ABC transporter permease [Oscillibacter sp.]MDD3347235.1 ABC transporter permease [Oscillibacter sp.]
MNIRQAIKMAVKSILGSKGRSMLTMLGIIIGIASVMTIVSTINGMNEQNLKQMEAMGTNRIDVSAYLYNGQNAFEALYNYCNSLGSDLVLGVTPNSNASATVVYGSKSSTAMQKNQENMWSMDGSQQNQGNVALPPNLYYGSDQYSVCNNFTLAGGRDLSAIDIKNYAQVCILGARAAQNFFNYADPVGQTMQINGLPFTVVGVYAEKDPNSNWSMDNVIVFPYSVSRLIQPGTTMNDFTVKAASAEAAVEATSRISGFLTGLTNNGKSGNGYANSNNQWQNSVNEQATMMSLVLGGIAAISLLVGGIGIMNIMLVTVTERTREIGIRRAIGAERSSIVTQFLIEAAMLCGIGGLIGMALGTVATRVAGKLLVHVDIWPSPAITVGAFLLSVLLGVVFGIYPAAKASKLQPVEALRAE